MMVYENLMTYFACLVTTRNDNGALVANPACDLGEAQMVLDTLESLRGVLSAKEQRELTVARMYFNEDIAPAVRRHRIRVAEQMRKEGELIHA